MRLLRLSLSCLFSLVLALAGFTEGSILRAAELLPPNKSIPEVVDHYIDLSLKEQGITPAALADDATILRRLMLDLVGRIPTAGEYAAYVASKDPDKKVKLVDRLLANPGFQRHLVNELDTLLATPSAGGGGRRGTTGSMREYLTAAVKENRPWDAIFRDLMLADEGKQKGSSQFLKSRIKDLDRLTTDVSSLFFGINISCAQCHDHPLVMDWKQDHYYGMKSFFARTYEAGMHLGERDGGVVQFKTTKNETKNARLMFLTGKEVNDPFGKPNEVIKTKQPANKGKAPAAGTTPPPPPKFSARAALADLALQPGQRDFFSRSIVNRLWHRLFGLGIINPTDQMHSANEPSHPELLNWLARDMAENGYDLKRMTRGLVLSKAYGRSSQYNGDRFPPARSFAVARLRALTPLQMATSLRLATTSPEQLVANLKPEELDRKIESIESSARGLASRFEQPRDDFQISVTEALLFSNNEQVQREVLADSQDRLVGRLKDVKNPEEAVELAAKNILTRPLADEEKKAMVDYLASRRDRLPEASKQMIWALLTSAEFRFNY